MTSPYLVSELFHMLDCSLCCNTGFINRFVAPKIAFCELEEKFDPYHQAPPAIKVKDICPTNCAYSRVAQLAISHMKNAIALNQERIDRLYEEKVRAMRAVNLLVAGYSIDNAIGDGHGSA